MVTTWLAIVGTAKVMTALGTLMRSNRKRSFSSTTISSAHLGLPEGQREVDPALGNRPLAQAEAVAKARVYMEFRLYSAWLIRMRRCLMTRQGAMPSLSPTQAKVGGSCLDHSLCPVYCMMTAAGCGRSSPPKAAGP